MLSPNIVLDGLPTRGSVMGRSFLGLHSNRHVRSKIPVSWQNFDRTFYVHNIARHVTPRSLMLWPSELERATAGVTEAGHHISEHRSDSKPSFRHWHLRSPDSATKTIAHITRIVLDSACSGCLDADSCENPIGDSTLTQLNTLLFLIDPSPTQLSQLRAPDSTPAQFIWVRIESNLTHGWSHFT